MSSITQRNLLLIMISVPFATDDHSFRCRERRAFTLRRQLIVSQGDIWCHLRPSGNKHRYRLFGSANLRATAVAFSEPGAVTCHV